MTQVTGSEGYPSTAAERDAVRRQVGNIISNPLFRNSKHYSAVLKYLVDCTLEGRAEQLKERTIGVEVFGRPPDYDTNADHVVRSAAAEIRKRLAQYYREPGREAEIQVDLHVGSYVPHFVLRTQTPSQSTIPAGSETSRGRRILARWLAPAAGFVAGALLMLCVVLAISWQPEDALDRFWRPVVTSPGPVLLCFGNDRPVRLPQPVSGNQQADSQAALAAAAPGIRHNTMVAEDAMTLARLAAMLQRQHKEFLMLMESATTFNDLRSHPSVLIGAFSNDWVPRLMSRMRFRLERQPPFAIRDTLAKPPTAWSPLFTEQGEYAKDYAIVTRCWDSESGQVVVVAAGLHQHGSMAAGEFLTSPDQMAKLEAQAPKGWQRKNLQVVLSTDVVRGVAGSPKIVASYFW